MTDPEFLRDSDRDRGGISGVVVGIVTDNADPEKLGRVKLTFPWRDADDESYWARVATPMAGAGMGTYFLPEVDDEVLVAFEDGDIHYPYVVGSLWNGVDTPPEENTDGANDVRVVRSRSGHELRLDDAAGGGVTVSTDGGHRVVLSDEGGAESVAITHANGSEIRIDADGAIAVTGGTSVTVEATELTLKGSASVTIESGGILTLNGATIQLN